MATLYIYRLVREDWISPPGKRTKIVTRDKPDLLVPDPAARLDHGDISAPPQGGHHRVFS